MGVFAYHCEEGFKISVECDRCHTHQVFGSSEFAKSGWIMGAGYKTYCPNCRKEVEKEIDNT